MRVSWTYFVNTRLKSKLFAAESQNLVRADLDLPAATSERSTVPFRPNVHWVLRVTVGTHSFTCS